MNGYLWNCKLILNWRIIPCVSSHLISQNFSCKVSDFYNHPLSIKLVSILLRETFLPFSSLYREVFWNPKKWEDLSSLYCARSKGRRNLGEGLESAGIWVKQRKLLCYRFTVFTVFFTFTCIESWALVVILKSLRNNNADSYENVTEKFSQLQSTSINFNVLIPSCSIF